MQKVLIIGLGLIGGSFAKALKAGLKEVEIDAIDTCQESSKKAIEEKIITRNVDFSAKLNGYDLIVLGAPLKSYDDIFSKLSEVCDKTLIIDLGSLKEFTLKFKRKNFIACHPIAGSDASGFENCDDKIFLGKKFVICKNELNEERDLEKIANLVEKIGFKAHFLDFKKHDEIYGLVSHLPQFLSFLTKDFSAQNLEDKFLKKAFRLDDSNQEIWRDIFKINEKNIEKFYIEFFENLIDFAQDLSDKKFDKIMAVISKTRENFIAKNLENPEFGKIDEKILFRFIVVISFLKITKIEKYISFAGAGFWDFISLINIEFNVEILKKNCAKILKIIDQI